MGIRRDILVIGLATVLVVACGDSDNNALDGGGTNADSGLGGDAGAVPPESAMAAATIVRGLGASVALTAPLVASGEQLRDVTSRMAADSRGAQAQANVENGVAGDSIVTNGGCVTFEWPELLRASVVFDECELEATGERLDGALSITVTFFPTTLTVAFTALTVGVSSLDGSVALALGGECPAGQTGCSQCGDGDPACAAERMPQQTISANLTVVGESTMLTLEELQLVTSATGASLSGSGVFSSLTQMAGFTRRRSSVANGRVLAQQRHSELPTRGESDDGRWVLDDDAHVGGG